MMIMLVVFLLQQQQLQQGLYVLDGSRGGEWWFQVGLRSAFRWNLAIAYALIFRRLCDSSTGRSP